MSATVKYNQTDFDENPYDFFTFLKYNGQPFTGTLVDDRWTCSFKDGNAEGRYVEYYKNGQVAIDCIYENGNYKTGKEWYPSGQLKSDDNHLYDGDGNLIRINGSWLYKNGVKRNEELPNEAHTFSSNGELAIRTIFNMKGDYKNTVIFYDKVLVNCYNELLINLYPDFDTLFYNLEYRIWGWVVKKYAINQIEGMRILMTLENHQNENITSTAKSLIESINNNELDANEYLSHLGYHSIIQ